MVQVKKDEVRQAILEAAWQLFSQQTYQRTTLTHIARKVGISSANLYVYFDSKLDILYAVYEPWMRRRLLQIESDIASVRQPLDRVRQILRALWKEIPAEENGFLNNIMQALSTVEKGERYKRSLLEWMETRIGDMIHAALPAERRRSIDKARLARVMVMALDGYSIHRHISARGLADDKTVEMMARLLIGPNDRAKRPRSRTRKPAKRR
ncbi:TetR/AcrR family transcriptional regulator [Pseudorhodoplanes sp.]|uniref:TetR/AcrR family transcriptional regulator n=1 Tax=Pseudorhodoplanes sp. TaxID=1934341 RepID=UPI003D0DAF3E